MIARILKYVCGVVVGLVLLSIISLWVMIGGPEALWYKLFPIVEYDNLEVVLEVDGEIVTIRGTARCSIVLRSRSLGGSGGTRVKRSGGDATVVLKDGRALVVPYTNRDWCYIGVRARRPGRYWWDKYKRDGFDERVPLKGHFRLLILDNGDEPTQIDLLLGPGYYKQPGIEFRLISSERWTSKEGSETYPHLEWLMGGVESKARQNKWVGGLVTEFSLSEIEQNPAYKKFIPDLKKAISTERTLSFGVDLETLLDTDSERTRFGVRLQENSISLSNGREPFRVPLFNHAQSGPTMKAFTGRIPSCRLSNKGRRLRADINFDYLDRNPTRLWNSSYFFWDATERKVLVVTYECVNTAYITDYFQSNKK